MAHPQAAEATDAERAGAPAGRVGLPLSAVMGLLSGLAFLSVSTGPLRDIDVYWHLLAGAQIASGVPIENLGSQWSIALDTPPWSSTQWLSELVLHFAHEWGGWTALAVLRVVTAITAVAVLAHTTLRHRPVPLAALPYVTSVAAIVYASQERPQQATFIGAAILGGVLLAGLEGPHLPRWYVILPATILWANLHGGWILVPVVLAVVALGRAFDHGLRYPPAWRAAGLGAASLGCGLLTPAGLAGVTAAFRLKEATSLIQEWQPTRPLQVYGWLTVLMLVFMGVAWARSRHVAKSEVLAFFVCLLFSWTAWRNVAPGLMLASPLVAARLVRAFPEVRRNEPRWSVPLGLALAATLAVVSVASLVGRSHLPLTSRPVQLAQQVGDLPPGQRVLNDFNAAGLVLFFGGSGTRVAIDGRTDHYGAQYIEDYVGLRSLKGDWEQMLDDLDPTAALFAEDAAIVHVLQVERGWKVIGREGDWVLLVPGP